MIRKASTDDVGVVASLAVALWSHHTAEELAADFIETICNENSAVFLCYENNTPIAFAQCGLRHDYVEGTGTSPVGYLKGIFVDAAYRGKGYAGALLTACEAWAKAKGCTEFASDCELRNEDSLRFHLNVGFEEANRIICFKKAL